MEMNGGNNQTRISTLVFMDLETTGLPSDVGKRNVHITEMSLIAIDRTNFEDDQSLRTINKLSLCMRPRSVVSPIAMSITGLYNDVLENQGEFDETIPKLLEYFFRRLQTPICLLAHNGNRFDFPVLQAELKRINYTLGANILCADTLVAFRSICLSAKEIKVPDPPKEVVEDKTFLKVVKSCDNGPISDADIESLLSEDLESFATMEVTALHEPKSLFDQGISQVPSSINGPIVDYSKCASPAEFLNPILNDKTPPNRKIIPGLNGNAMNVRKRKIEDPTYHFKQEYNQPRCSAKRALFIEPDSVPDKIRKITKFSLENLYQHFFNESPPKSHYAEMDCISLSKVCQKINNDFLPWVDKNSVAFNGIGAMW